MEQREATTRWQREDVAAIVHRLRSGGAIAPGVPDLPTHEGKVDLRGLELQPTFTPGASVITGMSGFRAAEPLRAMAGVRMDDVDLTWAKLPGLSVEGCAFRRVNFSGARLDSWSEKANVFQDCTFDKTSFEGALLGHLGSRYVRCRFERAKFAGTSFACAQFDDCEFIDCQLDGGDLFGSSFERCVFVGRLDDVWFRGGYPPPQEPAERQFGIPRPNTMKHVDFSQAELLTLTFSDDCDLSTSVVPESDEIVHLGAWQQTLTVARNLVPQFFAGAEVANAEILLKVFGADARQNWYIVNCRAAASLVGGDADFGRRFKDLLLAARPTDA